ncbi:arginase family protein [Micromonospora yasonensis]|uniref:arginase family protein n=1 Tax=Micromonospora yasonensis TaxID=1128667 RepID=UPI00222FACB4|nr:arginase family protein [Micromonospora yasonensis]MCW3844695.1 arginase family protein [Micromonospora yasonensis]
MMRRIAVLDAPTNLGLRPPTSTSVPGCAKAPGALRDHGLLARLRARDAGCLTPPRYDPGDWRPGDGVCHAREISAYSVALADRIGAIIDRSEFPLVLGGDCSVLLGSALAMHRLGEAVGGRIGLVFVDGHSDFRHPGNASYVGAAAGEDLALVTGRGQADLAAIEGRRPYFRDIDVVVLGIRAQDEYRLDLQAAGITTRPVPALRAEGAARTAQWAHEQLADCAGYWVHIDVDVLDPAVLPAVDAPDPGGIAFAELEILLAGLVDTPHCLGVELTVFDPDYDPDGSYAAEIVNTVVAGLAPVSAPSAVPPRLLPPGPVAPAPRAGNGRPTERPVRPAPAAVPAPAVAVEPIGPDPTPSEPVDGRAAGHGDRPSTEGRDPIGPTGPGLLRRVSGGEPAEGAEPVGPSASAGPGLLRRVPVAEGEPSTPVGEAGPTRPGADIA